MRVFLYSEYLNYSASLVAVVVAVAVEDATAGTVTVFV